MNDPRDVIRVGVNLLYLKPGRISGTEAYIIRVLQALETEASGEIGLTLFVNRRFPRSYAGLARAHSTTVAPTSGAWPVSRIAVESTWLALKSATRRFHVIHHVANTIPGDRTKPAVVTIHDLQPMLRPRDFGWLKTAYLRRRFAAAAIRSRVVMTPSAFVRDLLLERFDIDEAKVHVVPAPLRPPSEDPRGSERSVDSVDDPFFLYPAFMYPHKNHVTLIRAFARVAAQHPGVSLVLTGGRGAGERAAMREIQRLGLTSRIHHLGLIPRDQLDVLFRRAVAMTFPSRHEGYGLPVVEAMAHGCPVLASDRTALPEVVSGAGLLLDPDDVSGWSDAMERLLGDGSLRLQLAEAGARRVRTLTPEAIAARVVTAYREASA